MTILSFLRQLLLWTAPKGIIVLALAYWVFLLYMAAAAFRASSLYGFFRLFVVSLHESSTATHTVGIILTVLVVANVLSKKRFRAMFRMIGQLLTMRTDPGPAWAAQQILTEREVQNHLLKASRDSETVLIYAGDGGFLRKKNRQHKEICEFGSRCRILLNREHDVPPDDLEDLHRAGVAIRHYHTPNPSLRGRILVDSQGKSICLFARRDRVFEVISTRNQYISDVLHDQHDDEFSTGHSAYVTHLLFGLGGVLLDEHLDDFETAVRDVTHRSFSFSDRKHVCIDQGLACGQRTIAKLIEDEVGIALDDNAKSQLMDTWHRTWTSSASVIEKVKQYRAAGYVISAISNCDPGNRVHFESQGYFAHIDNLFVAAPGKVKPSQGFFDDVIEKLRVKPFQCVAIDDQREVLDQAEAMGMSTVLVNLGLNGEEKARRIESELKRMGVHHDE